MKLNYAHMHPYATCVFRQIPDKVFQGTHASLLSDQPKIFGTDGIALVEDERSVFGIRSNDALGGYLELWGTVESIPKEREVVFGKVMFREVTRALIKR